ncbi:OSTA/TMEM184 family protein [Aspergillus brunneoviolaceus CBS 621.78]|uniref:DUF300-domain-containing protein n=1 Tax=Aspergillus brunneoviolaceus CBS 621.78 TaxID=1450534 RepID=A0ACD1G2I8_9EURO|nr:DUF300-domain-containing protein [Aspergillus brunneoviolaceus CBS 621.78]RAH43430.1 DUF300-domain-containing protein [Aspergillus brunneoviolaceus CBS 621.78]
MGHAVCNSTTEDQTLTETPLWNGDLTFHDLCLIISGVFAIIASIVSIVPIMGHALHYTKPIEQRQVIRILGMVPVYSLVSWLSIYYYKESVYFEIIATSYEAVAICAFFTLLCHYIAPDLHSQKAYFRNITPKQWIWPLPWLQRCCGGEQGFWRTPRSGLTWFNAVWVDIFQYCLLRVLLSILSIITEYFHIYCEETLSPAFAYVWILALDCTAVGIAMFCLVQFYLQIKEVIDQHSPFLKLLCIKLVIFLSFWQSSLVSLLSSSGVIQASPKVQSPDITVGLPNLLISIEMALFAVLHMFAYPWEPYLPSNIGEVTDLYGNGSAVVQGGRWGLAALLDAWNPRDLLNAVARSLRWITVGRKARWQDPSYDHRPILTEAGDGARGLTIALDEVTGVAERKLSSTPPTSVQEVI